MNPKGLDSSVGFLRFGVAGHEVGEPGAEHPPAAPDPPGDGGLGTTEPACGLGVVQAFVNGQDDGGSEVGLQALQRLHDTTVAFGFEIHHVVAAVDRRTRFGLVGVAGPLAARGPFPPVEAEMERNPMQPGGERGIPAERAQLPPRPQEGLLGQVVGVLDRTGHPVGERVDPPMVLPHDPGERLLVPGAGRRQRVRGRLRRCVGRCGVGRHSASEEVGPGPLRNPWKTFRRETGTGGPRRLGGHREGNRGGGGHGFSRISRNRVEVVWSRFGWGAAAREETHLDRITECKGRILFWEAKAQLLPGSWRPKILVCEVTMAEPDIQKLENQLPAASGSAFAAARKRVLASGQCVLQSHDGVIYEVFPDGRKVAVGESTGDTSACE